MWPLEMGTICPFGVVLPSLKVMFRQMDIVPTGNIDNYVSNLVSKCSATFASVAAPPPRARQGFLQTRVYPYPLGAGSARTDPKMGAHSKLRKEPRRGRSYTRERDSGGCSVCTTQPC